MDSVSKEEVKVGKYRCMICEQRLVNRTLSFINEHRKLHSQYILKSPGQIPKKDAATPAKKLTRKQKQRKKRDRLNISKAEFWRKKFESQKREHKAKKRTPHPFYDSYEWLALRYQALKRDGRVCALCKTMDGQMHVDHIIPRSKQPELELVLDNLQVLCKDCNLGKSNKDDTDWRK